MNTKIKVEFKGETIEGILISESSDIVSIKLDSGYNANLKKSSIKEISRKNLNNLNKNSIVSKKSIKKEKLPKITIIHTGGTIASKVDYSTGAVSSKFTPEELLSLYPELNQIAEISPKMIGNLFSEDMRFAHYNLMLTEIKKAIENQSIGVIISHGTDTMHYTSAALEYAVKNLPIPILLVGAQRSSDRASSDAYSNLVTAVNFIIENSKKLNSYKRVGICMHNSISDNSFAIFDGINVKKMHSSRRDAFKQINFLPFAEIENGKIKILRNELLSKNVDKNFSYIKYNENLKIGFLKAHPNLFPEEINCLSFYDAVIIEGTGLGHLGINEVDSNTKIHSENYEALKKLAKKTKLIMGVQTVYGQTNMNVYSSGRHIIKAGVFGNLMELNTETLFIRAAYCLSQKDCSFEECWVKNLEN